MWGPESLWVVEKCLYVIYCGTLFVPTVNSDLEEKWKLLAFSWGQILLFICRPSLVCRD